LKKTGSDFEGPVSLNCRLQYEDRDGGLHSDEQTVQIPFSPEPNFYDGEAARKGILLTRFVSITKHWIIDTTNHRFSKGTELVPRINTDTGIVPPPMDPSADSKTSGIVPFSVAPPYIDLFAKFFAYFKEEMAALGEEGLKNYVANLQKIVDFKGPVPVTPTPAPGPAPRVLFR